MAKRFDVVGDGEEIGAALIRAGVALQPQQQVHLPPGGLMHFVRPSWMGSAEVPQGITAPDEELDPLPFQPLTLTSSTRGNLIARPQRPFRGERLILTATYSPATGSPTDVGGLTVIDPAIYVGATQVGAAQGQQPVSTYSPTAFGVRLSFPRSGQGTDITIPITYLGTITSGDSVIVTGVCMGRAVR